MEGWIDVGVGVSRMLEKVDVDVKAFSVTRGGKAIEETG